MNALAGRRRIRRRRRGLGVVTAKDAVRLCTTGTGQQYALVKAGRVQGAVVYCVVEPLRNDRVVACISGEARGRALLDAACAGDAG